MPSELLSVHGRNLLLLAAALAAGCHGGDDGPETYPVTGVVTLAGAPVGSATVTFVPAAASAPGAQATTDAEGKFNVQIASSMGQSTKRGLPAGDYRVTVLKMVMPPGPPSLNNPPKNVLPLKYANPRSSGLGETVDPEKTNHFEFRLDD